MLKKLFRKDCCLDCAIRLFAYIVFVLTAFYFVHCLTNYNGFIPILGGLLTNPTIFWQLFATVILTFPIFMLAISIPWLLSYRNVGIGLLTASLVSALVILLVYIIKPAHGQEIPTHLSHHRYFWFSMFLWLSLIVVWDGLLANQIIDCRNYFNACARYLSSLMNSILDYLRWSNSSEHVQVTVKPSFSVHSARIQLKDACNPTVTADCCIPPAMAPQSSI